MCEEIRVESSQFDEIVKNIKDSNLSRNKLPKLIIGTGLSATYKVPGMGALAMELSRVLSIHENEKIRRLWGEKESGVEAKGLEEGLNSILPGEEELVSEIKKVTALYILEEEQKLHDSIYVQNTGFSKLLLYLRNTCSVNNRILDVMTPNYDRIIEIICDKLKIPVITGFDGEVFQTFHSNILKKPEEYYNLKHQCHVRLFKPHGSLNWLAKEGNEYLTNDYDKLKQNIEHIEIITPGSSKYEVGMLNNTFRIMREDFNELISDSATSFSLLIYGYGFNDSHFNTVLFQNDERNVLILSKDIKEDVIEKILGNPNMIAFYQSDDINYMIYKKEKYVIDKALWDINIFAEIFVG